MKILQKKKRKVFNLYNCITKKLFSNIYIKAISEPVKYLFLWCDAMYKFDQTYRETQPLRD